MAEDPAQLVRASAEDYWTGSYPGDTWELVGEPRQLDLAVEWPDAQDPKQFQPVAVSLWRVDLVSAAQGRKYLWVAQWGDSSSTVEREFPNGE